MEKIFTSDQLNRIFEETISSDNATGVSLIERYAESFKLRVKRALYGAPKVFVFAGSGGNGADAIAIGRLLLENGISVKIFCFHQESTSPFLNLEKDLLFSSPSFSRDIFEEIKTEFNPPDITSSDFIIDGLFGTGINGRLEGGFLSLVKFINNSGATIFSVDVPSGLLPEGDKSLRKDFEGIIKAHYTYSYESPRVCYFLKESSPFIGQWGVIPVALSEYKKREIQTNFYRIEETDPQELLKPRDKFSHKGMYGKGLLISGSKGMYGAAALAAKSAIKSGIGLLTVSVPEKAEMYIHQMVPEAIVAVSIGEDRHVGLNVMPEDFQAIAIGPGIGKYETTSKLLKDIFHFVRRPMVLDADALNTLGENRDLIKLVPEGSILTPHAKEMERLTTSCHSDIERLSLAIQFAKSYNLNVNLKGAYSALITPEGDVVLNRSGNPGMATAGSGDVLVGVLLGFLAKGYDPCTTVLMSNYIHGLAGDLSAGYVGEESLSASDIIQFLPKAFIQAMEK